MGSLHLIPNGNNLNSNSPVAFLTSSLLSSFQHRHVAPHGLLPGAKLDADTLTSTNNCSTMAFYGMGFTPMGGMSFAPGPSLYASQPSLPNPSLYASAPSFPTYGAFMGSSAGYSSGVPAMYSSQVHALKLFALSSSCHRPSELSEHLLTRTSHLGIFFFNQPSCCRVMRRRYLRLLLSNPRSTRRWLRCPLPARASMHRSRQHRR